MPLPRHDNQSVFSNIMAIRKKYQEAFTKKHGIKLGLMSPFVRATALALQDQPVVNAGQQLNSIVGQLCVCCSHRK